MKYTPCEYIVWHGLPIIRKELAKSMINHYDLNQTETAKKLGISSAAVSQYLSGKRAKIGVIDDEMCREINISAERIIRLGNRVLIPETCRLCRLFTSKNLFPLVEIGDNCEIL